MRQWIRRHRRLPYAIPHTGPFQGSKDLQNMTIPVQQRNDGSEKMRFLRHPPCLPGPLLPSTTESRPTKTPTTGGMISRFHLSTRAHPRRADSSHPCRARATNGSRPWPAKTAHCNHGSGYHSSTSLHSYAAAVHAIVVKDE